MQQKPGLQLNLSNLRQLDRGKVELVFNHTLRQIVQDVIDRQGDKGKRMMTMKITATPEIAPNGALDTVNLMVEVAASLPKRRNANPYKLLPMADGTLMFQPGSPGDPRQFSMFEDESAPAQSPAGGDAEGDDENVSEI